eukprot:341675-Pyramimonas_sp.AAC.1
MEDPAGDTGGLNLRAALKLSAVKRKFAIKTDSFNKARLSKETLEKFTLGPGQSGGQSFMRRGHEDYTSKLQCVKAQLWLETPLLPVQQKLHDLLATVPREWTVLDRFLKTQGFLHDKLMSSLKHHKFEGAYGVWELSIRREHHEMFTLEVSIRACKWLSLT